MNEIQNITILHDTPSNYHCLTKNGHVGDLGLGIRVDY